MRRSSPLFSNSVFHLITAFPVQNLCTDSILVSLFAEMKSSLLLLPLIFAFPSALEREEEPLAKRAGAPDVALRH